MDDEYSSISYEYMNHTYDKMPWFKVSMSSL